MNSKNSITLFASAISLLAGAAQAQEANKLDTVRISSRAQLGEAESASAGEVGVERLALRPLLRPAELLEAMNELYRGRKGHRFSGYSVLSHPSWEAIRILVADDGRDFNSGWDRRMTGAYS